MKQEDFNRLTAGSGAVYYASQGSAEWYWDLVAISVITGEVNNRIRVSVLDENNAPAFGVRVRHNFGDDHEMFTHASEPVQFNLGPGSHYSEPNDPPNHILVWDGESDQVHVGNSSLIGFGHTDWQMTFRRTHRGVTPPPTPNGAYVSREELRLGLLELAERFAPSP